MAAGDTVPTAGPRWETPCVPQELRALQGEAEQELRALQGETEQVVDARDWSIPSAAGLGSLQAGLWWSPLALFLQKLCYPLHWVLFNSAGLPGENKRLFSEWRKQ